LEKKINSSGSSTNKPGKAKKSGGTFPTTEKAKELVGGGINRGKTSKKAPPTTNFRGEKRRETSVRIRV